MLPQSTLAINLFPTTGPRQWGFLLLLLFLADWLSIWRQSVKLWGTLSATPWTSRWSGSVFDLFVLSFLSFTFLEFLKRYFMLIDGLLTCVSVCHICVVTTESRRGRWITGTGVTDYTSHHVGTGFEPRSSGKEISALLAEPSLLSHFFFQLKRYVFRAILDL